MRAEQRGGGLRQRESDTRPYAERTLTVTTKLERFTRMACEEPPTRFTALMGLLYDPEGLRESFGRQDGRKAPGVDGIRTSIPSLGGRLELGAGWCNTPSPVLRGVGNESLYDRDRVAPPGNQAETEKTSVCLTGDENPAYSPTPFSSAWGSPAQRVISYPLSPGSQSGIVMMNKVENSANMIFEFLGER